MRLGQPRALASPELCILLAGDEVVQLLSSKTALLSVPQSWPHPAHLSPALPVPQTWPHPPWKWRWGRQELRDSSLRDRLQVWPGQSFFLSPSVMLGLKIQHFPKNACSCCQDFSLSSRANAKHSFFSQQIN